MGGMCRPSLQPQTKQVLSFGQTHQPPEFSSPPPGPGSVRASDLHRHGLPLRPSRRMLDQGTSLRPAKIVPTREHLGVETQRQWSDLAIARATPALLRLFSLITLWAAEDKTALHPRIAAWYAKKDPTFSDAIATIPPRPTGVSEFFDIPDRARQRRNSTRTLEKTPRDRTDIALAEHAEHDVDHKDRRGDQDRRRRGLECLRRTLERTLQCDWGSEVPLYRLNTLDGLAQRETGTTMKDNVTTGNWPW